MPIQRKSKPRRTCKVYKSCDHVPCGETMNKCRPSYCVPGSSRNWTLCNMSNWNGQKSSKYRATCRDESRCKMSRRTRKTKNSVDAKTLHSKMPYIWRFLKPATRKHMIELANQPVSKINIPAHVWPDGQFNFRKLPKNKHKTYKQLRKKYRNI